MISLTGLSKQFENETAIHYHDFVFVDGKSYLLLGASGCGKSTLLNLIAGILTPDTGTIEIDGRNMTQLHQAQKDLFRIQKIGYVFQDFKLIEDMTVPIYKSFFQYYPSNLMIFRKIHTKSELLLQIVSPFPPTDIGRSVDCHTGIAQIENGAVNILCIPCS